MANDITAIFQGAPTPQILHWLVQGNLASSMSRAIRYWVILGMIYRDRQLPDLFRYPDLRDRLYSSQHPTSEKLKAESFINGCSDRHCICANSLSHWLQSTEATKAQLQALTGFDQQQCATELAQSPFATVHRSLRGDLEKLAQLGWLKSCSRGEFQVLPIAHLPQPPVDTYWEYSQTREISQLTMLNSWLKQNLSRQQCLDLLVALETISIVQPNLEILLDSLSEILMAEQESDRILSVHQKLPHTFVNFDYILPPEVQDRIDDYHKQLEDIWHTTDSGVIQFEYEMITPKISNFHQSTLDHPIEFSKFLSRISQVTVYPVCIHYFRRAKYLSAYGIDPEGNIAWHNYRLDRITSERLKVLAWGDRQVPKQLKQLRNSGKLPTSQDVEIELRKAWGFKFYEEPQLLLIRFSEDFARWYVDNTVRHPTFKAIPYTKIKSLLQRAVPNAHERDTILAFLEQRSASDRYYHAWIRPNDVNIIQRLRDWRPNGEILAPISLRQKMIEEATQELIHYLPEWR
ncbi:MAG: TIGR03985 family CRISPR-associated protein [Pseudanabaena sp. M158S2SP1A06QC]|nr:TIGR03985 family CRISPR-associated protein [Pseudanabaena sp. M158S2SP1A06QC]